VTDATAAIPSERTPLSDYGQWLERGRRHQDAKRPIDALICYRRALSANPYAVQARFRLGQVLTSLGRDDEAHAIWRAGLSIQPGHILLELCLASAARRAGAHGEAIELYDNILATRPQHKGARLGLALSRLATGDENAYEALAEMLQEVTNDRRWDDLMSVLRTAPRSPRRQAILSELSAKRGADLPAPLLALIARQMLDAGDRSAASEQLVRAERLASSIVEPDVLRQLALVATRLGSSHSWAERYASACVEAARVGPPLLWPRRTAGGALRVAYLIASDAKVEIDALTIAPETYLAAIAGRSERIEVFVYVVGDAQSDAMRSALPPGVPIAILGASPEAVSARTIAQVDADVLIDLVGMRAPIGPLLAQRPARSRWTYAGLRNAHAAGLVERLLPSPEAADPAALANHALEVENTLMAACAASPWFSSAATRSAAELAGLWSTAVAAHQAGEVDRALDAYREVLAEQPDFAPAQYLFGVLLRDVGRRDDAGAALAAAVAAAPLYVEPRAALANLMRESGLAADAVELCEAGLELTPKQASLWRALGQARLELRDGRAAHRAFAQALELQPTDATTHYNDGVALQMRNRRADALRAYQRALVLDPTLYAADFNIGVIFREQGHADAAVKAFEAVLEREPRHAPAYKALAETQLEALRLDEWFRVFDRFEAACPNAFPLAGLALEACQYRADFAGLDRYVDRLSRDDFKPSSPTELVDCLETLLFLLLYFDVDPDVHFGLYKAYDKAAPSVYGRPLSLPEKRRPGRIRIGYLSGDLRNHVMGKMMWSALQHHDRERFEIFFYSLSERSDDWTERYRGLGSRFESIASLTEQDAAERIAADDLDILVDLSTHTHGARPGILALKPARVQITHVASAGVVGLSTIDFKLTDAFADLPEMQRFQIETLLPMEGCVYPYRAITPADEHPFHRDRLGIADDAIVIGAFVNPLKLSRRCLTLWARVLERIPTAVLAISPLSPERGAVFERLFSAVGIDASRTCVLAQGRNEALNQARYGVVDFTLDPMPYGGANGTLEALAMGVPVVTLVGAKHGERCGYSMLANLGVMQTVAGSGSEYVEIAVRLATDAAFMAEVRGSIHAGLKASPLTDTVAHTRNLERAYERALEMRYPAALSRSDD
jgi:predicted O-linked N-acetylglucosamine transferase (SPINDLY family)